MNVELPNTPPEDFREITIRTDRRTVALSQSRPCKVFDRPVSFFVKINGRCIEATPRWARACEVFRQQVSRRSFSFFTHQISTRPELV